MKRLVLVFCWLLLSSISGPAVLGGAVDPEREVDGELCRRSADSHPSELPYFSRELLNHLELVRQSRFARAFVIHALATHENENGSHWLVECAAGLVAEEVDVGDALQRVGALRFDAILEQLRGAERWTREYRRTLEQERPDIERFAQDLRNRTAEADRRRALELASARLRAFRRGLCGGATSLLCNELASTERVLMRILENENELAVLEGGLEAARGNRDRLGRELGEVIRELEPFRHLDEEVRDEDERDEEERDETVADVTEERAVEAVADPEEVVYTSPEKCPDEPLGTGDERAVEDLREQILRCRDIEARLAAVERQIERDSRRVGELKVELRDDETPLREHLDAVTTAARSDALSPSEESRSEALTRAAFAQLSTRQPPPPPAVVHVAAPASSNVMMALTDFVVTRAKAEVVLVFLERLLTIGEPWVRAAFHETFELAERLEKEEGRLMLNIGRVPLHVWRATLASDYRNLPVRALSAADTTLCATDNTSCRQAAALAGLAVGLGYRAADGEPVFRVLATMDVRPTILGLMESDTERLSGRQRAALRIVQVLAESYEAQGWVAPGTWVETYPYLLSARSVQGHERARQARIFRWLLLAEAAETWRGPGAGASNGELEQIEAAMSQHLDRLLRRLDALARLHDPALAQGPEPQHVVRAAGAVLVAASDLGAAFADGSETETFRTARHLWQDGSRLIESYAAGDHGLAMAQLVRLVARLDASVQIPHELYTVSGLAVALVSAQDGNQVRAAFEAAAAPVGGWREKRYAERTRPWITAYPGVGLGHEWVLSSSDADVPQAATLGVWLPIGLDFRITRCSRTNTSLGGLVQVVDLGALLNYRLQSHDEVEPEPNFTLPQVISPGFHFTVGFGGTPLTALVGGQFVPGMRTVIDGEQSSPGHALQLRIGFGVDVALFNL